MSIFNVKNVNSFFFISVFNAMTNTLYALAIESLYYVAVDPSSSRLLQLS